MARTATKREKPLATCIFLVSLVALVAAAPVSSQAATSATGAWHTTASSSSAWSEPAAPAIAPSYPETRDRVSGKSEPPRDQVSDALSHTMRWGYEQPSGWEAAGSLDAPRRGVAELGTSREVALTRYAEGKGHHIPAKSAFKGDAVYEPAKAPAIPKAELERLGVSHARITGAQQTLYRQFAASGKPLTWSEVALIERQALVASGMDAGAAMSAVDRAIAAIQRAGVQGPIRIPWSG